MQNMELVRLVDVFLFDYNADSFALYNVIRNIPYYVNGIGSMKENPEAYKFLGLLVNESPMSLFKDRANYPYAGILVF